MCCTFINRVCVVGQMIKLLLLISSGILDQFRDFSYMYNLLSIESA